MSRVNLDMSEADLSASWSNLQRILDFSSLRNLLSNELFLLLLIAIVFLYNGGYMKDLKDIKCYLLDMDGTIYLGNELIDGAKEFLEKLKEKNIRYIFLTNNSSKNKDKYVEKLNKLGIEAHREDVFSSGEATTIYLSKKKKGAKVFLLGTKDLEDEFEKAGFELVRERNKDIDFVVLGFDTTLTYEKLWIDCEYIANGEIYSNSS